MPPTIEWDTYVINVPKSDMVLIQASPEIRQLDVNTFRLNLKDIEDDPEGMPHPNTHNHSPPVTVAGANLARVVEILSPYTVTFEDGQYRVILVGANNNLLDVANLNNVSIAVTNSAGLQDLNSLQAASFQGSVALDVTSIYAGTDFPIGTRAFPVNNVADAITICADRGLRKVDILSDMTLSSGDFSDGYAFYGDSPTVLTVTLAAGANVTSCSFNNMTIQGTLDGMNSINECTVLDLAFFNGAINDSALEGTITLGGGVQADLTDCYSGIAGGGLGQYPTINMGGAGNSLAVRDYHGGLEITNATSADASFDISSGRVVFDSTVTGGTYYVRGLADVTDNSTGTATVTDQTVQYDTHTILKMLKNKMITDPSTGIMYLYDDDDTTVLFQGQLYEDTFGSQTYRGQGAERRERLA